MLHVIQGIAHGREKGFENAVVLVVGVIQPRQEFEQLLFVVGLGHGGSPMGIED